MPRVRVTLATAFVAMIALSSCSSSGDEPGSTPGAPAGGKPTAASPAPKPITKPLPQAALTQALLGDGETLPGWSLHGDKSVVEDGQYCNTSHNDSAPRGWMRGSDASYEYNGSTRNMTHVHICLFDTVENAHAAYLAWKGTEASKEQPLKPPVGDESTLVINPGLSDDTVYGFSRSGRANIRVRVEGGTGGDPSGAQATLAATLKRLQQLQDGKPATVRASDEQVAVPGT
ncbi:hypothetical protein [Streptomyces melanogenes]|uniref:Lipoprotein n=1 Tax=Streptomyces melanogenes TaxID=67326 RepID=A0ABZ1XBB2_9ACTN|nr:hypothetical protein [Streptomyces melanogenes]